MSVLKNRKLNTQKGFTLVELIVVLVLMMIFITLGVAGILTWQDWSRFKKENTAAETIFYSLQNQFTELDATDAFDSKVKKPVKTLKDSSDKEILFVANRDNQGYFAGNSSGRITYDVDSYYTWEPSSTIDAKATPIWINTPSTADKSKYQGSIYYLSASKGDYDKYLNKQYDQLENEGTKLLFDLLAPYISEKSILNGAIWVEFSPEARQVFSVCYSDRVNSFAYNPATLSDSTGMLDRTEETRRDLLIGYYAAKSLSIPTKGRDAKNLGAIYFENKETFNLVITEENLSPENHYVVDICPALDEFSMDEDCPLMTLEFKLKDENNQSIIDNDNLSKAVLKPVSAKVSFFEGYYASEDFKTLIQNDPVRKMFYKDVNVDNGSNFKMNIPAYVRNNAGKNEIVLVLDAADVQAQAYLCADKNKPEVSFINTFSFYRFGFDLDNDNIMKIGAVLESDSSTVFSKTGTFESPVFGNASIVSDASGNKNVYEINNARHLYNVRFETDYKESRKTDVKKTYPREFVLKNDIDWAEFTGNKYFFDSFKQGTESGLNFEAGTTGKESGINFQGIADNNKFINKGFPDNNISDYSFPGFRTLGVNDVFKADECTSANRKYYAISNLNISFAANMAYGVYGKDARLEWLQNNIADFNEYDSTSYSSGNIDWENINRFNTSTGKEKHPTFVKVMRGLYPLGLFAENSGTICDLELNKHRVIGMEEVGTGNTLVFTNMVGGFTGDNLGNLNNLYLRNVNNLGDANIRANEVVGDKATKVNGRTDVGGILGRESWVATGSSSVTLSHLENYGKVTGMENIGGIVGRAYIIRDFKQNPSLTGNNKIIDIKNYYFRRILYDDGYDIYGSFSDDGTYKAGSSRSITGRTVNRITSLVISDCITHGEVHGDELVYSHVIKLFENCVETQTYDKGNGTMGIEKHDCNLSNDTHQCTNIGGIAGTAVDGAYYDCRNTGSGYTSNWGYAAKAEDRMITIKNCNAYRVYTDDEIKDLYSKSGVMNPGIIRDRISYDYYVGGLVGYCKFSVIENCGNEVAATDSGRPFVFGRNYVGGLFGCYDFCKINDVAGREYNIVNNSNVIGVMYVGGFAGGTGIGCCKQENVNFRHPSLNEGSQPSQITGAENDGTVNKVKNTGVILGVKRSALGNDTLTSKQDANIYGKYHGTSGQYWQLRLFENEIDAGVGGIVGISRYDFENADNIQTDKDFALKLIFGENFNPADLSVNTLEKDTYYGGTGVGGIFGIGIGAGWINNRSTGKSTVNAVVYGEKAVGGAIGGTVLNDKDSPSIKVSKVVPNEAIILGQNKVGGLVGLNNFYTNEGLLNKPFRVYGISEVGGLVGSTNIKTPEFGRAGISLGANGVDIFVRGKEKVGGAIGYQDVESPLRKITLTNVTVEAEHDAGGVFGYLRQDLPEGTVFSLENVALNGVKVKATRGDEYNYAGGIVGLIPAGVTINSASFKGSIESKSRYLGEIAEQNNGTITNCKVNSMSAGDNNVYFGGLAGINSGTIGTGNVIDSNVTLTGKKILGGFVGKNIGTVSLGTKIDTDNVKLTVGNKSGSAIGVIIGENASDKTIDLKELNLIKNVTVSSAEFAGGIVGINGSNHIICHSEVNNLLKNDSNSSNVRYQLANASEADKYNKYGVNIAVSVSDVNNFGLIVGRNEGSVTDVCVFNYSDSYQKGGSVNSSNVTNIGGIVGQNGNGTTAGTIRRCFNFMNIIGGNAAGIAGNVGGKSYIEYCDNYGAITGTSSAAGILANASASKDSVKVVTGEGENAVTTYELRFNDCVNAGHILSAQNTKAAGISASSNNIGQYTYCRNYGKVECTNNAGTVCGITCDNASDPEAVMAISNCLEAGGLNEENNGTPIVTGYAQNDNFIRNFYVYGDYNADLTGTDNLPITFSQSQSDYRNTQFGDYYSLYDIHDYFYGDGNDGAYGAVTSVSSKIQDLLLGSGSEYNELMKDIYSDFRGNGGQNFHAGVDKWDQGFAEFMQKCTIAYTVMTQQDVSGPTGKFDKWWNEWDKDNATEWNNLLIFIKFVKNNGRVPSSMQEAINGQNGGSQQTDNSHWPVQLYTKEDGTLYLLAFKRSTYYFASGISGLSVRPNDFTADAFTRFLDLDDDFIKMVNDGNTYPNSDNKGSGVVIKVGFVGNLYQGTANNNPNPAPAPPNNNSGNDTGSNQNQGTDNNAINNQSGNDANQQGGTDSNQANDQNQGNTDNNTNGAGTDQNQSTDNQSGNDQNQGTDNQSGNDTNQQGGTDSNQANNQNQGNTDNNTNGAGTDSNQSNDNNNQTDNTTNNPAQDPASIPSNDPNPGNDGDDNDNDGN